MLERVLVADERILESSPDVSLALPKREIHLAGSEVRGFPPARDEQ